MTPSSWGKCHDNKNIFAIYLVLYIVYQTNLSENLLEVSILLDLWSYFNIPEVLKGYLLLLIKSSSMSTFLRDRMFYFRFSCKVHT